MLILCAACRCWNANFRSSWSQSRSAPPGLHEEPEWQTARAIRSSLSVEDLAALQVMRRKQRGRRDRVSSPAVVTSLPDGHPSVTLSVCPSSPEVSRPQLAQR